MGDESHWSCLGKVTLHDLGFNKNFPGYRGEGIPAGCGGSRGEPAGQVGHFGAADKRWYGCGDSGHVSSRYMG